MKKLSVVFLAVCMLSGCSVFNGRSENITVTTNVPQSEIFVNNEKVGTGNVETKVKKNQSVQIMVVAEGYLTTYRTIDTKISTAGALDIVGTAVFFLPAIGLFFPGFYRLDTNKVLIHLDKALPSTGVDEQQQEEE